MKEQKLLYGQVSLPGSKSLSNRVLLLAGLAEGSCVISNILWADDTRYMARALVSLGAHMVMEGGKLKIIGTGGKIEPRRSNFYIGNCGTAYRFLLAILSLERRKIKDQIHQHPLTLDGNEALRERPIIDLILALREQGVDIRANPDNKAPLEIKNSLKGGLVTLSANTSSQYISALLIAALFAPDKTLLHLSTPAVSKPYIEMTIQIIKAFGGVVECLDSNRYQIPSQQKIYAPEYFVEPDLSSASYFLAAIALRGGEILLSDCYPSRSLQGDRQIIEVLVTMAQGVYREEQGRGLIFSAPGLRAIPESDSHKVYQVNLTKTPDLAPTVAVVAAYCRGVTVLEGIAHLRHKETDRIQGISECLKAIGIHSEATETTLTIYGGVPKPLTMVPTFQDHRLAMAFTLAQLMTVGIVIENPEVCRKSYPTFYEDLSRLSPNFRDQCLHSI